MFLSLLVLCPNRIITLTEKLVEICIVQCIDICHKHNFFSNAKISTFFQVTGDKNGVGLISVYAIIVSFRFAERINAVRIWVFVIATAKAIAVNELEFDEFQIQQKATVLFRFFSSTNNYWR